MLNVLKNTPETEDVPRETLDNPPKTAKGRRGLRIFIGVVLVLLVLLGGAALYASRKADQMLNQIEVQTFADPIGTEVPEELQSVQDVGERKRKTFDIPVAQESHIRNILLIGSDAREGEKRGRSDAMILVSINDESQKIHLTSLMRAIYVSIPKDPDPEMAQYWNPNSLLNAAHTWGGPRLLLKTIQRNFRVHVQDYVEVDFEGFKKVIDILGGVDIVLTEKEAGHLNHEYGWALTAELQHLDGEKALAYSRIRYIDTDFVRTSRQRRVVEAMFGQLKQVPPQQLIDAFSSIFPYIKTNLQRRDIKRLLLDAPNYACYAVDQLLLPLETTDAKVKVGSREAYDIDWESNLKRLHEFIHE